LNAALQVDTTIQVNNTFIVASGDIVGGTVNAGTGGEGITVQGTGYLEGVVLNADVLVGPSSSCYIHDSMTMQNGHSVFLASDGTGAGSNLLFQISALSNHAQKMDGNGFVVCIGSDPASDTFG